MPITLELLKTKGACAEQIDLFAQLFPEGVEPTEALAIKHSSAFDWRWASTKLLSVAAKAGYHKVRTAAYAECDKVRTAATAGYDKVITDARADFDKTCDAAWTECDNTCADARAEYNKACSVTFVKLWNGEN